MKYSNTTDLFSLVLMVKLNCFSQDARNKLHTNHFLWVAMCSCDLFPIHGVWINYVYGNWIIDPTGISLVISLILEIL